MLGVDPRDVSVPVVGGHAGVTILPLLSQVDHMLISSHGNDNTEILSSFYDTRC